MADYQAYLKRLEHLGELVAADGNRPIDMAQPGYLWVVLRGQITTFCKRLRENDQFGRRHPVLHVNAGEAFCGIDTSSLGGHYRFTAVGVKGTRLVRLVADQVVGDEREAEPQNAARLLSPWYQKLSAALTRTVQPIRHKAIGEGSHADIPAGTVVLPAHGMLWIRCDGPARFISQEVGGRIEANQFTLVTERTWLETLSAGKVEALSLARLLGRDDCLQHMHQFHSLVLAHIPALSDAIRQQDLARIEEKRARDRQLLQGAMGNLALASRLEAGVGGAVGDTDTLFAACQLVARSARIELVKPLVRLEQDQNDPLGAISRASRIRTRKVYLEAGWWQISGVPLLARLVEDDLPVALIPHAGRYEWIDPLTLQRERVTGKNAYLFQSDAYQFYRPLPERHLTRRDLLHFISGDLLQDLGTVVVAGALGGLLGLALPVLSGHLFDVVIPQQNLLDWRFVTVGLVMTAIAMALFTYTRNIAMLRVEGKAEGHLQAAMWDRILRLPTEFFKGYTAGDLSARVMGIATIRGLLSESVITALVSSIFAVFNVALLFYYSPILAVPAMLVILLTLLPLFASVMQIRFERERAAGEGRLTGMMYEWLGGIAKLRIAGAETNVYALWSRHFAAMKKLTFKIRTVHNLVGVFNEIMPLVSLLALFALVGLTQAGKELTTGAFLAFLVAFGQLSVATTALSDSVVRSLGVIPLMERLKPILQATPEVDEHKVNPGSLRGGIDVAHVSFAYNPGGAWVLRDVNFSVNPGEFVAIVGPSGSGKSTLLRLLLGFEQPDTGSVYYDGKDLGGLDTQMVRRQIGVVLQNSRLMTGSVLTNILGSLPLGIDDAWEAARLAALDADILAMPMGMHTVVSEGAGTLSGGQRQRIIIARALVHRPRLLYFDEATSALDNETQAAVSHALENLHVTRIVIAHRLSTIRNADRILYLEKGVLQESGTYEELMEKNEGFATMAKRQLS